MLIIPAENAVNWKRPPWITLGLMLACVLVFTFYQGADQRKLQMAVNQYLKNNLQALEAPVYEDYQLRKIRQQGDSESVYQLQQMRNLQANQKSGWLAVTLLMDRDFYQYLLDNRDLVWASAERARWQQQRGFIEDNFIGRLSSQRFGLIPAQLSLHSFISYQFLHGGWGHLLGNLVFLFLLGFTVEKALGAARFLLAYLLCGALSGLMFTGFSAGSLVPLIGASGAISGLMGMYVAIYGLQKIRFFIFLGVYFNYFRAPAIAILPVWLGKEIYDYWYAGATGVAYMAHAGGLLAGAVLVGALGKSWFQVKDTFFEPEPEAEDAAFTEAYGQAMAAISTLDFELASTRFEALREAYPQRALVLQHQQQLAQLRPDLPEYRHFSRERMDDALSRQQFDQVIAVWREYLAKGEAHQPLAAEDHNRVLFASLKQQDLNTAEKAFERLRSAGSELMVNEACRLLVAEFEKRQMAPKAQHYRQWL
jgi:membrane associated rhomboid family serine protease